MIDGRKDSGSTVEPSVSFNRCVPPRNANIYAKRTPRSGKQPIASSNHTLGRLRPLRRTFAFGLINSAFRLLSVHQLRASSVMCPLRLGAPVIIAIPVQRYVVRVQINRQIRLVSRLTFLPLFQRLIVVIDRSSTQIYNSKNRGVPRFPLILTVHSALRPVSFRLSARLSLDS